MSVQRDVNPENDKKLNKMLDAKFGGRGKMIVKGSTARTLDVLLKRAIAARKQFEDTIFDVRQESDTQKEVQEPADHLMLPGRNKTNPAYKRVKKHAQHDQSSHGRGRRAAAQPESPEREGGTAGVGEGTARRELSLFTSNDSDLHRQQERPIQQNLQRKYDKGIYDHEKSVKLWRMLADSAAKKYAKEHLGGVQEARRVFPGSVRNGMAQDFADSWRDTMELEAEDKRKKMAKGKITHTQAYNRVKDKPGVKTPHALAQHIVEQAGGEPKKIFKIGKHGQHDQKTHGKGRAGGARRRPETKSPESRSDWKPDFPTTDTARVKSFASKYPKGWHGYAQDKRTIRAVEAAASTGHIELSRETNQFRLKRSKKVTKSDVDKHAAHDQSTHGRAHSKAPSKVRARIAGHKIREAGEVMSPRGTEAAARTLRSKLNPKKLLTQIDGVLDDIDAGGRIARRLRDIKSDLSELFNAAFPPKEEKVTKAMLNAEIEKGISHSLELLTNALNFIGDQNANSKISEADDKKLGELIDEINGMVGYLKDVKEQGFFEKAVEKHGSHDQSSHGKKGRQWGSAKPGQRRVEPQTLSERERNRAFSAEDKMREYKALTPKQKRTYDYNIGSGSPGGTHAQAMRAVRRATGRRKKSKVSKGEPNVPDSGTAYRPSYTTPAVRREQERQGIKPNAKGRGTSTARAPGY